MEKDNKKPAGQETSTSNKMMDQAAQTFKWWNRLATINADDPIWVGFIKIGIRIIGIIILLLISPFVILGLIIGITAAL